MIVMHQLWWCTLIGFAEGGGGRRIMSLRLAWATNFSWVLVTHVFNHSTREAEAGGSLWVRSWPVLQSKCHDSLKLHTETLSWKTKWTKRQKDRHANSNLYCECIDNFTFLPLPQPQCSTGSFLITWRWMSSSNLYHCFTLKNISWAFANVCKLLFSVPWVRGKDPGITHLYQGTGNIVMKCKDSVEM